MNIWSCFWSTISVVACKGLKSWSYEWAQICVFDVLWPPKVELVMQIVHLSVNTVFKYVQKCPIKVVFEFISVYSVIIVM